MQVVERDFTLKGKMRGMSTADAARLKGHLPFYSVDTQEEVDALIELAVETGEFYRQPNGQLVEVRLAEEQTLENLNAAGEALARLHAALSDNVG